MTLIIILALAGIVLICLELILPGMILGLAGIIALVSAIMLIRPRLSRCLDPLF